MRAYQLTAIDTGLTPRRRVSLGFYGSQKLAAEVLNSYQAGDEPYANYRVEECEIDDGEPVIEESETATN